MSRGSIPDKIAEQVEWSANLDAVVGPKIAAYGVPVAYWSAMTAANTALQQAWAAASKPETRTRVAVQALHSALKAMREAARNVVLAIRANPAVTPQMLVAAGITVPKAYRTPSPIPATSPILKVTRTDGRTATIELLQAANKRGKPARVMGAMVFTHVGAQPPFSAGGWQFATLTGRTTLEIPFPPSETGDTVWMTAAWVNDRKETGPAATPVSVNLPAAGGMPAEAGQPTVRLAA